MLPLTNHNSSLLAIQGPISHLMFSEYGSPPEEVSNRVLQDLNLQITPPSMAFLGAFEGKKYNQKLTIQNCGKNAVFIRICQASSYAFEIKPLARGYHLSPGLTIVRFISYTYMSATAVPYAWIPIHINDQHLDYKLHVLLSEVLISPIPQQIDFGTIDAGHSAAVRMLSLRNDGSKGTRFAIDLGRNEIELLVEPSKGIIQPHETLTFQVECLGTTEGTFSREFWVKCETPLRIGVKGSIITPQLESVHPNATQDFTLVDFPKTYFGTFCIKTFVIRNVSAKPCVYCTQAIVADEKVNLEVAHKYDPKHLNFQVTPAEGSMLADEDRIFHIWYRPVRDKNKSKHEQNNQQSFCCIRIVRVPCLDFSQIVIPGKITVQDQESSTRYPKNDETLSVASGLLSMEEKESLLEFQNEVVCPETPLPFKDVVKVLLYGEAESASITIRPDLLNLLKIPNNKPMTRELLLVNNSSSLPIIFNYKKVSFVNVEPISGILPPSGRIEVGVTITPAKLGSVHTKVAFDLLFFNRPREDDDYIIVGQAEIPLIFEVPSVSISTKPKFNMGITPMYIQEVGTFTDDVRFNTPIKMPKATLVQQVKKKLSSDDDALIAFPNDRPKSLRPWKIRTACRTICAGIPRAVCSSRDSYELSKSRSNLKNEQLSYYMKYIRQEAQRLLNLRHFTNTNLSEYDISNTKCLLLRDVSTRNWTKCAPVKLEELKKSFTFMPLTTSQLKMVKVYPYYIKLGKMAPLTTVTRTITVNNKNNFAIRVLMKSRKSVINFPDGERKVVKPLKQIEMKINYNSCAIVGRYNAIVDFIINDTHSFAVAITVDVVPKCAKFLSDEITFYSDGLSYQYLDLFNPVNIPVTFSWQVPESCFTFEPMKATIAAGRHLTCVATYNPHHVAPSSTEVTLCSEKSRHQNVGVVANLVPPKVAFRNHNVEFKDIPLNLPLQGTATLRNLGNELVTFSVLNPEPIMGISISPIEGILQGCSEQTFTINIKISACVTFQCIALIEVQKIKNIKLHILGNVIYPAIVMKPDKIHLKKIVPNCFEKQVFIIMNKSAATTTIDFQLDGYSEYSVLETSDFDYKLGHIKQIELKPQEQKELYLYFNPMGAASYCFYLPIIINGLLGPPCFNMPDSQKPSFFTEINERDYVELSRAQRVEMPYKLPIMEIHSAVAGDMLRFSKLYLNFNYFPYSSVNSETHSDLKIWNASKDTCKFCIRIDELEDPFSLTYLTGNEIETLEYSIVCVLAPEEEVILKANFLPRTPGIYHIRLPIYIKNYLDGNVFNYLILNGCFPSPTITASQDTICLEPVPLKCETEYKLFLKTMYHSSTCQLSAETDISELRVNFVGESLMNEAKQAKEIQVSLKCNLEKPTFLDASIRFFCACNAECFLKVKACFDCCTVTTHAFVRNFTAKILYCQPTETLTKSSLVLSTQVLPTSIMGSHESFGQYTDTTTIYSTANMLEYYNNFNETCYPMFPEDSDNSEYGRHMRKSVTVLEEWFFHQCFSQGNYYKIPNGFAAPPEEAKKGEREKKKKKTPAVLKIVELLKRLVGPQINKHIPIREIPEDNLHRINYMFNVYMSTKEFIIRQGGLLPHVFPETLLCYNDYLIFMKNISSIRSEEFEVYTSNCLSEDIFYRISKQNWMDILLQIYKVFVLARIRFPPKLTEINSNESRKPENSTSSIHTSDNGSEASFSVTPNISTKKTRNSHDSLYKSNTSFQIGDDTSFWQELSRTEPRNSNIFSEGEIILLHWLEYHFNNQRKVLWRLNGVDGNKDILQTRNIRFFDFDLRDSLVLIAVTTAYCPYLIPYLHDIYVTPINHEEALHNASKLVQSWNIIGLSFTLPPKQIVDSNGLQMLMLTNYLYEVLPTLYPSNTVYFKTGLSTTCSEKITVTNLSNSPITYNIMFFRNEHALFSVSNTIVTLPPRKKKDITIEFNARLISIENVTMVLNGETPKRTYAKSMAFTLIGEPIPSYATTTTTISAPLYQILDVSLLIQSPYIEANFYDVYYAISEPENIATCKIMSWAAERSRKVPKRITSNQVQLAFDSEGVGVFDLTVCCVTTYERAYWIIFKNANVGDFTIKLITIPEIETKMYISIPVSLQEDYGTFRCSCKGNNNASARIRCPRTIKIEIPCRNDFLWNAVAESMMKVVDEADLPFWQQYLGTSVGIQIHKWMVEEVRHERCYDIQELFESKVNYKIIKENNISSISLPDETTIENVHCLGYHEILVHIESDGNPVTFQFTLISESGLELRHYRVNFLANEEYNDNENNDMQLVNVQL